MQRLVGSKSMTTIALIAGAAALSVFGSAPAGAQSTQPGPAAPAAHQSAHESAAQAARPDAAQQNADRPGRQNAVQNAVQAAASVNGRVVSNVPLLIRAKATSNSAALGSYAPGTIIHLTCKVNGQTVDGNPRWYKLADRTGWVAARYVVNLGVVPWC